MAWSDHSMVLLSLCGNSPRLNAPHWKLNQSLLRDPIQVTKLQRALQEYFCLNDVEEISAETLWAAHKVMIQGKFMQIASQLKRERLGEIERLEKEFTKLRSQHKKDPSKVPVSKLDTARLALNLALTAKADKKLRWTGAKFCQQWDKIGPMLASKLSLKTKSYTLLKFNMNNGTFTLNPQRIMQSFQAYYSDLYRVDLNTNLTQIDAFLEGLPLPFLGEGHGTELEAPITTEEVLEVIKKLKGGTAPGPDGFPVSYYKGFADILAPYLTRFFNSKAH